LLHATPSTWLQIIVQSTNYCALQNLTAGKVIVIIIIDRYVYRLYWYLEA